MNEDHHRIVFNQQTREQRTAAKTENCRHRDDLSGFGIVLRLVVALPYASAAVRLTSLALATAILAGGISVAYAQIAADPAAAGNKRPVINNTANGLPLVQIAPPNAAGLSHNQYQQFNVDKSGAILNNAGNNVKTQLGGWVGGNPNLLPNGGARIILNEVTSANPSALRGYIEVAGRRADVIVSNPNGILVDGAGFINTSRGVITTGTPLLGGSGSLDGFRVNQGMIEIGRGGFNDQATHQVDLIARSIKVNGELVANQLNVLIGANQVNYADLGVQVINGTGDVPTVAIDVSALGGMYANKIRMLGTEAGVGVASYGKMATSAGDFSIDSKGRVTLAGNTSSAANLAVTAKDGIDNSGTTYARQNTQLTSTADITNSGTVAAQSDTTLVAHSITSTGTLAAGLDSDGIPAGAGNLRAQATDALVLTGSNLATQHIDISGASLNLQGATTQAGNNVTATATAGDINHSNATTSAVGKVNLNATGKLDNRGAQTGSSSSDVSMTAASIDAGDAITQAAGNAILRATSGLLQHTGASTRANGNVMLTGADMDVSGATSQAGGNLSMVATNGNITGRNANTAAVGNLDMQGKSIDLTGATTQAGGHASLSASVGDIVNQDGKLTAGDTIDLRAGGAFNNSGAYVSSGNWLRLLAASLNNSDGTLETVNAATGNLNVTSTNAVTNANGKMHSARNLGLRAGTLLGDGATTAGADLAIALTGDYTQSVANTLSAVGNLDFSTTGILTNYGSFAGGNKTTVTAAGIVNQAGALFNSNGLTTLSVTNSLINYGRIYGNDIALSGNSITNDLGAVIAARNTLNVGATTIVNRQDALMKSEGDMAIGGALDADHKATGAATSITNSSATIDSGGTLAIASAALLNTNAKFVSAIEPDPSKTRSWTEYEIDGNPRIYTPIEVQFVDDGGVRKLVDIANGSRHNDYTTRHITETTKQTVVTQTAPAQILSRSDMTLTGGTVTNDKSVIVAGGNLNGNVGGVNNGGTNPQGEMFVHRDITSIHHTTERCAAGTKRCNKESTSYPHVDLPVTHFDLGIWTAEAHTVPANVTNPSAGQTVTTVVSPPSRLPPVSYVPGSVVPQFGLPNNQFYLINTAADNPYLVVTDPAYTNYRNFLSSDYLLDRLSMNPALAHKRLGDGYYEQQSVNDQILQLTGRKTLGAYASNEAQYQALMEAGITYAQQFKLLPGLSLSAAQMAALTTDLVWLVEQNVTLPDGTTQKVLAPVVYLSQLHAQDVKPTGALIAAENIDLNVNGTLNNAGTLKANSNLIVNAAQDINNTLGTISSNNENGNTLLLAGRDINNQSGTINGHRVGMLAGRDINVATIANTTTGAAGTQIGLDKTGSINAGTLTAQAGRDVNLNAAVITTTGDASVVANRNINLGAVTTQAELNATYDDKNHLYKRQEQVNGTLVDTGGNATFVANNDLNSQAAYINAGKDLTAVAGGSINIGTARQTSSYDQEVYTSSSGPLSSHSVHSKDKQIGSQSVGSTFSGDTVTVQAGKNLNITGSNVVSTAGTNLAAVDNVNIVTSQNTANQTYSKEEKTSGVFSGGGIGVTIGTRTLENDQTSKEVTNNGSTVGSTNGNVNIVAGKTYTQTGSNLMTPEGDIHIAAKRVDINTATDTLNTTQDTHFKQSGVTLQVTSPVLSALQTAQQMKQASSQTKDARLQALAGATAGLSAVNAADTIAQNPATAGGINVSISLGASKSDSHSEQSASTAIGSTVAAGGNVSIAATGDGNNSDLTVAGSSVIAKNNIALNADHDINLIAGKNTAEQHSSNSNSSASVGIGFSLGGSQNGFTINAGVSGGRGNADGTDVGYTNTMIAAGKQLSTSSGNDTNLKGAVASGEQVTTTVGNNLNIESLQDTSTYNSKQQSVGVSVSLCIPPFCVGSSSASANVAQSKINSNYASVTEQSGIKAGDGGFIVNVSGNTDLKGGQIASTNKAVQDNKNSLTTATLTESAIQNHADYKGQSVNIGGGYNFGGGGDSKNGVGIDQQGKAQSGPSQVPGTTLPADKNGLAMASPVVMNAKGSASSTTQSGISGGQLNITNNQAQQEKTSQTAQQATAAVNRDVTSDKNAANNLKPIFNEKEIQAGFAITGAFASEINTYVSNRVKEADAQKKAANDPDSPLTADQRAQLLKEAHDTETNWGPGGTYRQIATALTAAASGNVTGGAGQFAQAASINYLQSLGAEQVKRIADGLGSESARAALHAVVGCAGAAAQGANCGAGAMGASASSVIGSLLGPANNLSNEEKEARKNAVTSLIAGIATTGNNAAVATGAGQIEAENNHLVLPLSPPLIFPGNQKLPNGKTPGYVATEEDKAKAADKGKPINGGDADSGLLANFGDRVKEFGEKVADRGMQALCQANPLACASNVIMQSAGNGDTPKYVPSPKHVPGGWGTEMNLDDSTAQNLLNNSIQGGKQKYGVHDGQVYEFQPDNAGGWHGYPIPGNEAPTNVLREFLSNGKITKSDYNKLIKGK